MDTIKLVYVDAVLDKYISAYLATINNQLEKDVQFQIQEIEFAEGGDVLTLIKNKDVQHANILLMDSELFKNDKKTKRVMGEQVILLLKKINPFIKVIVISQHKDVNHIGVVAKYKPEKMDLENDDVGMEYYNENLTPRLQHAVRSVMKYRTIRQDIVENEETKIILDQIDGLMHGDWSYSNVQQDDIDNLILHVKNLGAVYE